MKTSIRFARTHEERQSIYRFRYQVYIEEMHRFQTYADHQHRLIEEPFDATGHLLFAEAGNMIIGTVRTNFGRETDLGFYRDLFELDSVGSACPFDISLTTKLMLAPAYRSGTTAVRLALAMYDFGRANGIRHDFIDCNSHLEPFFSRLGYAQYCPKVVHPEYGLVQPMRLDLDNSEHLRAIGSPLALSQTWNPSRSSFLSRLQPV